MEAMFVDPRYRGQGIGALLVRHGLELHPDLTVDVNEHNLQALSFYERLGFKPVGVRSSMIRVFHTRSSISPGRVEGRSA
jgi:putative acetyltransferase